MINSISQRTVMSSPRSVTIDGRTYPASQRNLVAASLLARPERPRDNFTRPATWSRA